MAVSCHHYFSSILQCVDARNDYTGLVIATVVIRVYDAHGALLDGLCVKLRSCTFDAIVVLEVILVT